MLATITSTGYKFVLLLHILAVIVGFGTVFLNGVYGKAAGDKKGPEALFLSGLERDDLDFRAERLPERG